MASAWLASTGAVVVVTCDVNDDVIRAVSILSLTTLDLNRPFMKKFQVK